MSCPDWSTLTARRDQNAEGELLWDHALAHLDGCEACREQALVAEPTLIFRRLPTVESGSRQIDEMKQAVAVLRRAQPIVEPGRAKPSRKRFVLRRLAAAVAMVAGSGLLYGILAPELDPAVPSVESGLVMAGAEGRLHIEIQVLNASTVDRGAPMFEHRPAAELVEQLKKAVDYDVFGVIAQGDVQPSAGEVVATKLGRDYKASFKTGEMSAAGTVLLRDFEMEKVSANKSRQAPAKFLYSELELSCENPLIVEFGDPNRDPLILAITCRWEPIGGAR